MEHNEKQLNEIKQYIFQIFSHDVSGHDYEHMHRVAQLSRKIAEKEASDVHLCEISGWVHDLIDHKLTDDVAKSKQELTNLLNKIKLSDKQIQAVVEAIDTVSFSKGVLPTSKIGQIVQDADRLDAIGAIGVARAFSFGASRGRPLYAANGQSTIEHFDHKLFKIKDQLHTTYAKQLATERHQFLELFYQQFLKEWPD
ncbi:HD domain-containing protein [Amphibacillus cookii]|uniref:HD domain-containing protein n=1 Tax=Amphibacillus cookii TaxID=767787 RepID=UPI00195EF337|nr:HD domain-containing protein [Amphibacillus cookii]MBM7542556.1 uncharacterized protein [Amphibacillus cookii]